MFVFNNLVISKKSFFKQNAKTVKIKHLTVLILFMSFQQILGQSPILQYATATDFCTALKQIVADYPNGFENIKAKKVTGERSWENYYTSKVNPEGTILGKITGNVYVGYFAKEIEDHSEAEKIFTNLQQNLETCPLPFQLLKVSEEKDKGDHKIVYQPAGAQHAYISMLVEIKIMDFWWEGIDVSIKISTVKQNY